MNRKEPDASAALHSALASLAAEVAAAAAPEEIEARVLAEFDRYAQGPTQARMPVLRPWFRAATAAMAASLAAVALLIHPPGTRPADGGAVQFVAIPYVAPPAPYERTEVIRTDVPIAALITAGFDVHVADPGGALRADLLIGQDGRVLAVRLITNSVPNSERRINQ